MESARIEDGAGKIISEGPSSHFMDSVDKGRRIFIIEGLLSACIAILMKWWLADWPDDAKFLTTVER